MGLFRKKSVRDYLEDEKFLKEIEEAKVEKEDLEPEPELETEPEKKPQEDEKQEKIEIEKEDKFEDEQVEVKEEVLEEIKPEHEIEEEQEDVSESIETEIETEEQEKQEELLDEETEDEVLEEEIIPEEKKEGFFTRLRKSLLKTKNSILGKLSDILGATDVIDEDLLEEIEEALYTSDLGVKTTEKVIDALRERIKKDNLENPEDLKTTILEIITNLLEKDDSLANADFSAKPYVVVVVGVNGNGKTTTIGKLAHYYKKMGKKVLIGAADTFRAAAVEQLEEWANRAKADFIKDDQTTDPAAVAYNAYKAALSRNADVVLIDTAGRLHNKAHLMKELEKIIRVIKKLNEDAPHEVLLVLDATTGQNAVSQAKSFSLSTGVTGLVLTKLDGTAKGGVAIAINQELSIPIKFIGIGEKIDDVARFDPEDYVKAIFD